MGRTIHNVLTVGQRIVWWVRFVGLLFSAVLVWTLLAIFGERRIMRLERWLEETKP